MVNRANMVGLSLNQTKKIHLHRRARDFSGTRDGVDSGVRLSSLVHATCEAPELVNILYRLILRFIYQAYQSNNSLHKPNFYCKQLVEKNSLKITSTV